MSPFTPLPSLVAVFVLLSAPPIPARLQRRGDGVLHTKGFPLAFIMRGVGIAFADGETKSGGGGRGGAGDLLGGDFLFI